MTDYCGVTGYCAAHLPAGAETDGVMRLLRLGAKFDRRMGKQPGYLHHYLVGMVGGMDGRPSFEKLLDELTLAAQRRDCSDGRHEPIERVSRSMEVLIYHDPIYGEKEIDFCTLRNRLTAAKKALKNKLFTASPKP